VIDALEKRFEALASLPLDDHLRPAAIARSADACMVALSDVGLRPGFRRYELPSWTLRGSGVMDGSGFSVGSAPLLAAGMPCYVAALGRATAGLLLVVAGEGARIVSRAVVPAAADASPHALAIGPTWAACALRSKAGIEVCLLDVATLKVRAT